MCVGLALEQAGGDDGHAAFAAVERAREALAVLGDDRGAVAEEADAVPGQRPIAWILEHELAVAVDAVGRLAPIVGDVPDRVIELRGLASTPAVDEVRGRQRTTRTLLHTSVLRDVVTMPVQILRIADSLNGINDRNTGHIIPYSHGVHPAGVVPRARERDLADDRPPAVFGLEPLEQEELAVAPVDPEVALPGHRDLAAAVLATERAARGAREDADRLHAVVDAPDGLCGDREPTVLRALEHQAQDGRLEVGGDEDLVLAVPERAGRATEGLGAAELELENLRELVRRDHERISGLVAGLLPTFVPWGHDLLSLLQYLPQAQRLWISSS